MTAPASGLIGQSIKRVEDDALVHGAGRYTDDFRPDGTTYMAVLRSPHPKARITAIDTAAARALPGVVDVITGDDTQHLGDIPRVPMPFVKITPAPMLCRGTVAAVGAPLAAVVAETAALAEDALALIDVAYEPLPSIASADAAMAKNAPLVFEDLKTNIASTLGGGSGDVDKAMAAADKVVKLRVYNPRLAALAMEPRAILVVPEGFGRGITVYAATQAPHSLRWQLAQTLGIPDTKIRVIAPDVGGAFGSKGSMNREDALCAFLAMRVGRPVKYVATRTEDFLGAIQGRDMAITGELAAKADGTFTALKMRNVANYGAYMHFPSAVPPLFMLSMGPGCYKIANVSVESTGVLTNTVSTGPYRGAGRPETVLTLERLVDLMARALDMDPVDIRRKNFIQPHEFPYKTAVGSTYDSGDYGRALDRALELAGYDRLRKEQAERRAKGELVGIGVSTFVEPSSRVGYESGVVRVETSGRVTAVTGASPHGQGHETTFAQIVADKLKMPFENVQIAHGDTMGTPVGIGTYSSRSAVLAGSALVVAAERVIEKAKRVAGKMLEVAAQDIELRPGGLFGVVGVPARQVPWAAVAIAAYMAPPPPGDEPGLEATSYFSLPPQSTAWPGAQFVWPFGSHIVSVSIARDTGEVAIEKLVAVDDCGNMLNPMIAEGQVQGGLAQALGQGLFEEVLIDETGRSITTSLMDYAAPRAHHIPPMMLDHTVTPSPFNPLGVKGVGESGSNGLPPALANAVMDALAPLGVTHIDMPFTAPKIWQIIKDHS